jgi:hypothetical protein
MTEEMITVRISKPRLEALKDAIGREMRCCGVRQEAEVTGLLQNSRHAVPEAWTRQANPNRMG